MKKISSSSIGLLKYKMALVGMINILTVCAMSDILSAGYLGISLAALAFLISVHSLWLSAVVTKYVRGRNVRNQYRSSQKFLKGALFYVLSTGAVLCGMIILCSERLGNFLVRDIHISICFMVVAVCLPIYGLSEAISGYLQGMGFYTPVKLFYLVRQLTVFTGSIAGMKFLGEYGEKVARLKHNEAVSSVYNAFGALSGLLAGSIAGLILLLVFCLLLHSELRYLRSKDNSRYQESAFYGFCIILRTGIIQGIRCGLLFSALFINYILYIRLCKKNGDSISWIKTGGFLFGEAAPVMLILLMSFALLNYKNYRQLAGHWKNEAYGQFREKVYAMLLGVFALALPLCASCAVMAEPILKCLTKDVTKEGCDMFICMMVGALMLILGTMAWKLPELWNETVYLFIAIPVSFAAQTAFAVLGFKTFDLGAAGIVYGMILQAALLFLFFFAKFFGWLKLSGVQIKKLIMAVIVSLAGALIVLLIYQAAGKKLSPVAAIAVSVLPGLLLYLAAVTLLQIVSDKEAEHMPGGALFLRLNGILRR